MLFRSPHEMDGSYPVVEVREGLIGGTHKAGDVVHFQPRPDVDPPLEQFFQGLDFGPIAPEGRGSEASANAPGPMEGQGGVGGETE